MHRSIVGKEKGKRKKKGAPKKLERRRNAKYKISWGSFTTTVVNTGDGGKYRKVKGEQTETSAKREGGLDNSPRKKGRPYPKTGNAEEGGMCKRID